MAFKYSIVVKQTLWGLELAYLVVLGGYPQNACNTEDKQVMQASGPSIGF